MISNMRSMRDIATRNGLTGRGAPRSLAEVASELARLEHEKTRLDRELRLWIAKGKQTEAQLKTAEERIAAVKRAMESSSADLEPAKPGEVEHGEARQPAPYNEVTLEY